MKVRIEKAAKEYILTKTKDRSVTLDLVERPRGV